jgi:hypothetical protein
LCFFQRLWVKVLGRLCAWRRQCGFVVVSCMPYETYTLLCSLLLKESLIRCVFQISVLHWLHFLQYVVLMKE